MPKRRRKSNLKLLRKKLPSPIIKYVPERILDKIDLTHICNKVLYFVRWPNSWEPLENIIGCAAINNFENSIELAVEMDVEESQTEASQEDKVIWDVHEIIEKRNLDFKVEYLIKWKDSWMWNDELNCLRLIREFNSGRAAKLQNDNNNDLKVKTHIETGQMGLRLRAKIADSNAAATDNQQTSVDNKYRILINDNRIERILYIGMFYDQCMFLFQRLNGERALIPTKVANIKYPNAVMDFYEQHLQIEDA